MGRKYSEKSQRLFLIQCSKYLQDTLSTIRKSSSIIPSSAHSLDPEDQFLFSTENATRVNNLILTFKNEEFSSNEVSQIEILDVFMNVILEAL